MTTGGFGDFVRARRLAAGLSQEELAELAKVSVRTIRNVESGQAGRPRGGTVRLLADALRLPEHERASLLARTGSTGTVSGRPSVPAQLPAAVSAFTGRHDELRQLVGCLTATDSALTPTAVISGPGGIGKTTLAVRAGHLLRDRFPDGQLYVDLAGAGPTPTEPGVVLTGFLRSLGVDPAAVPAVPADQEALLRTLLSGRRLLMVLDNARDEQQYGPLLPGSPGCAVLITSRARLTGSTATGYLELPPLSRAEGVELLAAVAGPQRVAAEPDAAAAIVSACDELPLAVRIAASRLASRPQWDLAGFAAELADTHRRLAALQVGSQAVAASFDTSYRQLDDVARRMFRLPALADCAEIGLDAAAAMIGEPADVVRPVLENLVDVNLLQTPAPSRYRYHDLVRLYARERSTASDPEGERDAALLRLCGHLLATTRQAERHVRRGRASVTLWEPTPPDEGRSFSSTREALEWEDVEVEGMALVARQLATVHLAAAATLLDAIGIVLDVRGHLGVLRDAASVIVAEAVKVGAPGAGAVAHGRLTYVAWRHFDTELAIEHGTRSAELARQAGDHVTEWRMVNLLGAVYSDKRRDDEAERHFTRAIAAAGAAGDEAGAAMVTVNLSLVYIRQGRYEEALECTRLGMEVQGRIGNREFYACAVHCTGAAYLGMGEYEIAREHLEEGIRLYRDCGEAGSRAVALLDLARLHRRTGDPARGAELCREALELQESKRHRHGQGLALAELGNCLADLGDAHRARNTRREALGIFEALAAPEAAEVKAQLSAREWKSRS